MDEIDLREVIVRLWAGKWLIAASVFVMATVFLIAAFVITPVYRASTVLVAVSVEGGNGGALGSGLGGLAGIASMAGIGLGSGDSNKDEAIAVLQSRQFLEKFIDDHNLLPLIFNDDWDETAQQWKDPDDVPTPARAHEEFVEDILAIAEDRATGLIGVSVDWRDRESAADWTNELIERLNREMRTRALQQAEESLVYLKEELSATPQVGIQEAINRLIEAQINKRMLANVTEEYAFRVVDRAMAPDEDDEVWPNKPLLLLIGIFLGGLLGIIGVLFAHAIRAKPGS